ncbi:MAG: DUF1905 domain-containing protein [Sphingobium sp.]
MAREGEVEVSQRDRIIARGQVILWNAEKASWHFLDITGDVVGEIHFASMGRTGGFGSVKVRATIGQTSWATSLFPHKATGGFVLPLKAAVRKSEGIAAGDEIEVMLEI